MSLKISNRFLKGGVIFLFFAGWLIAEENKKKEPLPVAIEKGSANAAPQHVPAPSPKKDSVAPPEKSLYQEILGVLQSHYAAPESLSPSRLSQAAIHGMLDSLHGSARLVDSTTAAPKAVSATNLVNSVAVIAPFIGHLRVKSLGEGVGRELQDEVQKLVQEEHVVGLVLDLRFAKGGLYSEIAKAAACFFPDERNLFTLQHETGNQSFSTEPTGFSTEIPVTLLVNNETEGPPEILAAVLQDQGRALLIGRSATAGQAFETSDAKLSNGMTLRFASGKIALARGGDFFLKSAQVDIDVPFDPHLEREIHDQPFRPPESRLEPRFISEAVLTGREKGAKYSEMTSEPAPPMTGENQEEPGKKENKKTPPPEPPSNHDAVLLRAIDLLKSISALELPG